MSIRNWFTSKKVSQQLTIAFLFYIIQWFAFTYLLDWLNERERGMPIQGRCLFALIMGIVMLLVNHWKSVKMLFTGRNG
jgi:predicted MFS family arabinose efflux permease